MDAMTPKKPPFPGYAPSEDNPVLEVLTSHRSVRRFKDIPVSDEALDQILDAAQRAPNGGNMQAYSIIVVRDLEQRRKLSNLCANQRYFTTAGALLIFCADMSRLLDATDRQGYRSRGDHVNNVLVPHENAVIASQYAAIAAESMGFGTCTAGVVRNKPQEISDLLELPQHAFASLALAIGVPDEDNGLKPRLPRRVVVSYDRFSTQHQEKDILAYDRLMARTGIYHGRFEPITGVDPNLEETFTNETYGWLEHTARRMANNVQENKRAMGPFLKKKGFHLE